MECMYLNLDCYCNDFEFLVSKFSRFFVCSIQGGTKGVRELIVHAFNPVRDTLIVVATLKGPIELIVRIYLFVICHKTFALHFLLFVNRTQLKNHFSNLPPSNVLMFFLTFHGLTQSGFSTSGVNTDRTSSVNVTSMVI